ncbi:MAG: phosphoglucosamine mutase [Bacteroidales bacterium]|nr:phosphoglucosamine mutase [Bacteroidales bacterium]MDD3200718.1 phosphoglucosamine mutase [Bacteroidales bacterium]
MTLIKSISGIRGTIGGEVGNALTPIDIVKFTSAYAKQLKKKFPEKDEYEVVVGRDARISGEMVDSIVCGTLMACGINVVNAGLASTPTTEMAVLFEHSDGGIILTASHNPKQWNALKLLNEKGEFLNAEEGDNLLKIAEDEDFDYPGVEKTGKLKKRDFTDAHINAVINYPLVDLKAIKKARFSVVLDSINSVGGIVMPELFKALGVKCYVINGEPDGDFAHNPEPLPANLVDLCEEVKRQDADLGVSVDPDVDRLAFICETGVPFGEEYTLVAVSDYVLSQKKGPTVSNISSSRALKDVTEAHGCEYFTCKVGEVNASTEMQRVGAVIGGEGNGGVIVPDLHYGRDALIGVALFLSNLAHKKMTASELRATYPDYFVSKNKIEISDPSQVDGMLTAVQKHYAAEKITTIDGLRVDFEAEKKWFVLRKSNTEPIIRIYAEAPKEESAEALAQEVISIIKAL